MNFSRQSTAGEQGNGAGDPREVPVQQDVPSPNRLTRSRQATRKYQIKGSSPFHPHHVSVFQKHLPKRANATPPYHIISSVRLLLIRNMVLNRLFYFNDPSTEPNQPYQVPCKLQWSLKDQFGHHHRSPGSCQCNSLLSAAYCMHSRWIWTRRKKVCRKRGKQINGEFVRKTVRWVCEQCLLTRALTHLTSAHAPAGCKSEAPSWNDYYIHTLNGHEMGYSKFWDTHRSGSANGSLVPWVGPLGQDTPRIPVSTR